MLSVMTGLVSGRMSSGSVFSVQPCQVWTGLHSALPHFMIDWLVWSLGPLLPTAQAREGVRTVVWLAGGGASHNLSGRSWHSCQLQPQEEKEILSDELQKISDTFIQKALSS